jgi:hypothetical protein
MRRVGWVLVLGAALACGKLFTISVDGTGSTVIGRGTLVEGLLDDFGFDELAQLDISESEELQNQGVEPGDIQEVVMTDFTLTATDPPGADLAFLTRISVFVESPGLPKVLIAEQTAFPPGQAEVAFDLTGEDITDYAVADSMTITTEAEGGRPEDDTTIDVYYALDVGVTAQGCRNGAKR